MPCSSMLVMHRMCGRCFFSMPAKQSWMVLLVGLGLGLLAQVLDGADEEAAGAAGGVEDGFRRGAGFTCSTMNCVTARGV